MCTFQVCEGSCNPIKCKEGACSKNNNSLHFSELERLVVLRIIRPDKMIFAIKSFVSKHMGEEFIHVPSFDMAFSFADSNKLKPMILVLYPGCDPLASVYNFTPERAEDRPRAIKVLSLGQGQGPAAEEAIMAATHSGSWVILQNCHLAEKWMERLVKVWEDKIITEEANIHPAFRLWLTCYATPNFPSQLLQTGVKVNRLLCKDCLSNLRHIAKDGKGNYSSNS